MLRLFNRGQREESAIVNNLKRIGIDIHSTCDDINGQIFIDLGWQTVRQLATALNDELVACGVEEPRKEIYAYFHDPDAGLGPRPRLRGEVLVGERAADGSLDRKSVV